MDQQTLLFIGVAVAAFVGLTLFKRRGQVSRDDAHRLVKEGAALVDVRSPGEFASGHLPGAVNVPLGDLDRKGASLGKKDRPVVLYCASGTRSAMALSKLKGQGFTNVQNLGAMTRWN
jgi:phage shock protein E